MNAKEVILASIPVTLNTFVISSSHKKELTANNQQT